MVISIDEQFVLEVAPNPTAAGNGKALMRRGHLLQRHISPDQTLIFGHCQGSGREPYLCACDFSEPSQPAYRCTCPSRQFPCKHCLALMFAYVLEPQTFTSAEVPDGVRSRRKKSTGKPDARQQIPPKPKKVNTAALAKKIKAQLAGLDLLEKLTRNLVRLGISNMNAKTAIEIQRQARQLGDTYLPGAQFALWAYTSLFYGLDSDINESVSAARRESIYRAALDRLATLTGLIKQGRAYLQKRLADPQMRPDTETSIAAWLGHAWTLDELRNLGQLRRDAELLQLAFNSFDEESRLEHIDTGVWCDLAEGGVYITKTFRPRNASHLIKPEDSVAEVAQVPELMIYPGDMNPRIRWKDMTTRPPLPHDFERVRGFARDDFADVVKQIKNHLKSPLADKQPVVLLRFQRLGLIANRYVIEDRRGQRLCLTDQGLPSEPPSLALLRWLPTDLLHDQVVAVRFRHDLETRRLEIKPLSIVAANAIVRLTL